MSKKISIMWFRRDLRLTDNPALREACSIGDVIPVYIRDTVHPGHFEMGAASRWWLHHSLRQLNRSLDFQLHVQSGDPVEIIQNIAAKTGASKVLWNRCYEPWQIARDKKLKNRLQESGMVAQSFNGNLLWEPWKIMNKAGSPYKVFTPYYRKGCLQAASPRGTLDAPQRIQTQFHAELDSGIDSLNSVAGGNRYEQMQGLWQPGEMGASKKLRAFLSGPICSYKQSRDFPGISGTSNLSPHLHFGEISPNQVWYSALDKYNGDIDDPNLDCFLSELGWREFSHYLLYHFPALPEQNFNKKFNAYQWRGQSDDLTAWHKGQTGVPFVDAGMRELWHTGYMHNRVRMIVGSYLVKNLRTHWRQGEAWFRDCLLDADLAANSASWQWVAGSGADASPFFRIFNPVFQGEKFDQNGEYVRKYCPELKHLPDKYIHRPWEAPADVLDAAGIRLGKDYPEPLVDLKVSRTQALEAYEAVRQA